MENGQKNVYLQYAEISRIVLKFMLSLRQRYWSISSPPTLQTKIRAQLFIRISSAIVQQSATSVILIRR